MRKPLISLLVLLGIAPFSTAAEITEYNFDGGSFASSVISTQFSATDLTSPTLPLTTTTANGTPQPSLTMIFDDVGTDFNASFAANNYYSFTVTPAANTDLSFEEINFDFYKNSGAGAPVRATLLTSLDGFTGAGDIVDQVQLAAGEQGIFVPQTFDLSSLASNVTTPTEFRIYLDDAGATTGTHSLRLDSIVLNGTAVNQAVPEPASVAIWSLLGMGLVGFGYYRTRRKK